MAGKRQKYDAEFREGAVRIVLETDKPAAQVARDLGGHEGALQNWVTKAWAATPTGTGLPVEFGRIASQQRAQALHRDEAA